MREEEEFGRIEEIMGGGGEDRKGRGWIRRKYKGLCKKMLWLDLVFCMVIKN